MKPPASRMIRILLQREDFRHHPLRAIFRRLVWRLRWSVSRKPWLIHGHGTLPLYVPYGGAAALIYYQGTSEPEVSDFIKNFLKPGMVFVDVGAHLGEYTVLASAILKGSGYVHAFEARPDTFEILTRNVRLTGFCNIAAQALAVWHEDGFCQIEMTPDPSVSALRLQGNGAKEGSLIQVKAVTLDHYFADTAMSRPTLIKIDVEGAELHVLRGARALLTLPPVEAPVLIFEYGPTNAKSFGYSADEVCRFLRELEYSLYQLHDHLLVPLDGLPELPELSETCNLVAAKSLPSFV